MHTINKRRVKNFIIAFAYTVCAIVSSCAYGVQAESPEEVVVEEISAVVVDEVAVGSNIDLSVEVIEAPEVVYFDVPLEEPLQDRIFELCEERGIDPAIIIAMIERESRFRPSIKGDHGRSYGLMQIQPKWHQKRANELGCPDLLNPYHNVTVGIDLLGDLIETGGSLEWALMAYNGGAAYANRLAARGEVSDYAKAILSNAEKFYEGVASDDQV